MQRDGLPVGCNPPEGCFICKFRDCVNNIGGLTAEFDFGGFKQRQARMTRAEYNKRRNEERRIRAELHLCTKCGKPLTPEDGNHKTCRECRERKHKYMQAYMKKKGAEK